jgi:hypothetical protein
MFNGDNAGDRHRCSCTKGTNRSVTLRCVKFVAIPGWGCREQRWNATSRQPEASGQESREGGTNGSPRQRKSSFVGEIFKREGERGLLA